MAWSWSFFWCQPPRLPAAGDSGKHERPGKSGRRPSRNSQTSLHVPRKHSAMTQAQAHTSTETSYGCRSTSSGARYQRVTTCSVYVRRMTGRALGDEPGESVSSSPSPTSMVGKSSETAEGPRESVSTDSREKAVVSDTSSSGCSRREAVGSRGSAGSRGAMRARPKSQIFSAPDACSSRFAGLMSRWITSLAWMWPRARNNWRDRLRASAGTR
mmetsp:Transcript_7044/g.20710  ORF Transcript_7044/g.20710 Transcript_7044/m.20710 type:complete len:214 (-) Transcript_7044:728-1369(-)